MAMVICRNLFNMRLHLRVKAHCRGVANNAAGKWVTDCISQWHELPFHAICGNVIGAKESAMQSMNISLPDPLKEFVDGQIAQGRYSSASEYVRELIRAD